MSEVVQEKKALNPFLDKVAIPAYMIPAFRVSAAVERGVEQNLLFKTWGGIGDQICAEPTLRFAIRAFKGIKVSLASELPELFSHLKFEKVFDLKHEQPDELDYLTLETIVPSTHLMWNFACHMLTNAVDFPALCALRCQLPVADREVQLSEKKPHDALLHRIEDVLGRAVFVHPGRHWEIKTFPADWWNAVLSELRAQGVTPILIGGAADDNRSTVDVDTTGCLDLRCKTSLLETIWLLKRARVLLTNDSSPLHMAAAGDAWIGYIATCKHPDHITHWRKGQWGYKMQNHGRGGIWEVIDYCPNKAQEVLVDKCPEPLLRSWLPEPKEYAQWAVSKLHS